MPFGAGAYVSIMLSLYLRYNLLAYTETDISYILSCSACKQFINEQLPCETLASILSRESIIRGYGVIICPCITASQ